MQKFERQIERHCRMVLQSVGRLFEKDKALTAVRDKGTVLKFSVVTVCFALTLFQIFIYLKSFYRRTIRVT